MLGSVFENVKITGVACAVPDNKVCTEEFIEEFSEKEIQRFVRSTGIKSRYLTKESQCTSDLCYAAAKQLMEHKGYGKDDIDALILVTQTQDYGGPATSFVLQKRLGLSNDCIVFDVDLGCSAFPNGVLTVASMIKGGAIKRALLLIGDAKLINEHFEHNRMLFGDVGTACILERGNDTIKIGISSEGEKFKNIIQLSPGQRYLRYKKDEKCIEEAKKGDGDELSRCYLDGDEIFYFSLESVPKIFREFFEEYDCSAENFDYFLFHQANAMIIKHVARRIKAPLDRVPINIDKYGNTGGGSLLLALADLVENEYENLPDKIKFISVAFGVGMSLGICSFEIDKADVLPIIYTNDYYEEGFLEDFFKEIRAGLKNKEE